MKRDVRIPYLCVRTEAAVTGSTGARREVLVNARCILCDIRGGKGVMKWKKEFTGGCGCEL